MFYNKSGLKRKSAWIVPANEVSVQTSAVREEVATDHGAQGPSCPS